jgi:glucosamine-6-phosphate deaminase
LEAEGPGVEPPIRELKKGGLQVRVYPDRAALGRAAAAAVAEKLQALLKDRPRVGVVFAAASSQNEFVEELGLAGGIDWNRVTAFHMDEYLGLTRDAPQSLGRWLRERLFDRVRPGEIHYLDGAAADSRAECQRYGELLRRQPPQIVCLGIGENGHLAFNDPHVADFNDPLRVKVVEIDAVSRMQQVREGHFPAPDRVPRTALTLTIPELLSAPYLSCAVPGPQKATAVRRALRDPLSADCPATALRGHGQVLVYLDDDSARLIDTELARR